MGEPPKKDYPPGWNDPPMLNYSPTNPPPKSRITNKRVAFPLTVSSPTNTVQPSEASKMPPLPSTSGNACVEDLYLKASENFKTCLEKVEDEGIKEQIWQMLSAWQSGKFPTNVQNLLTDLSINILDRNTSIVNKIHLQLTMTMDDAPIVKIYLPALNHLINPLSK